MNKKIGSVLFLFAIIASGTALNFGANNLSLGDTLNQEEFDAIDFDSPSIKYNFSKNPVVTYYADKGFTLIEFSNEVFEKVSENTFVVEQDKYRYRLEDSRWNECLDVNSEQTCRIVVVDLAWDAVQVKANSLDNKNKRMQTSHASIPFEANDLDFTRKPDV